MRITLLMFCLIVASLLSTHSSANQDVKGSQDHPLLSRFPGSYIALFDFKNFDEYHGYGEDKIITEGKITRIAYKVSKDHSTLEVFRSYENALKGGGFTIDYQCSDKDCRSVKEYLKLPGERYIRNSERFYADGRRALVAKRDNDYVFLFVYVSGNREIVSRVNIVEGEAMKEGQIRLDAGTISREIQQTGSIAVYDILFDVDKADVKASSTAALQAIANYLKSNATVQLYVVGHTDNTGSYDHNLSLSKRRAQAVVQQLSTRYGITATRLTAAGVGPIAPIASNSDNTGRAQNRRVQLVAR